MTKGGKPETTSGMSHAWIKDIKEDDHVHGRYLVKVKKTGQTKNGDPFISITLSDRTGDVESRVWENALELSSLFNEGDDTGGGGTRNLLQEPDSARYLESKGSW